MSSSSPLRIGVVGVGTVAREVHLPMLRRLGEFQVVAVADPDVEALERAGAMFAPPVVQTADPMVLCRGEAVSLDAVLIASPTRFHAEQMTAALRAGLHVYVEKPLAARLEEAEELARIELSAGQIVQMGFNYRFDPAYAEIARRIRDQTVGRVLGVSMAFRAPLDPSRTWRDDEEAGGGVLLDLFSHDVDLLGILGFRFARLAAVKDGDGMRLTGTLRPAAAGGATHARDGGAAAEDVVPFEGDYAYRSGDRAACRVTAERGVLGYDRYRDLAPRWRPADGAAFAAVANAARQLSALGTALERRRSPWRQPTFGVALQAFAEAATGRSRARPVAGATLADGLESLRVVEAARRSAREDGRTIMLDPAREQLH